VNKDTLIGAIVIGVPIILAVVCMLMAAKG